MAKPNRSVAKVLGLMSQPGRYLMATHRGKESTAFELMPDMIPVRADVARALIEPQQNMPMAYQIVSNGDGLFENTPQTWRVPQ